MDTYDRPYLERERPLIYTTGLQVDADAAKRQDELKSLVGHGTRLSSNYAELPAARVARLSEELERICRRPDHKDRDAASDNVNVRMLNVSRTFALPTRKAVPPPQAPSSSPPRSPNSAGPVILELHSPLSPLSPVSPLFPDGLMTPTWLAKHQTHIPAVLISFLPFDTSTASAYESDVRLKQDINETKTALSRSGCRTRLTVVLIAVDDNTISSLDERLADIRRATGLDAKAGLLFLPDPMSQAVCQTFVQNLLAILKPITHEYYRDLTKHTRRKKGRSFLPVPLTTRSAGDLHSLGWSFRYEFKLGVFASFRDELETAEKHFLAAIDSLFAPEGPLLNATSDARFVESRNLADVVAIRNIQCQLARNMPSNTATSWLTHRVRCRDLHLSRTGGVLDSTWFQWESRWAEVMGQLVEAARLTVFDTWTAPVPDNTIENEDLVEGPTKDADMAVMSNVYAPAERPEQAQDISEPFAHLHHPGYWFALASQRLALCVPPEEEHEIESHRPDTPRDHLLDLQHRAMSCFADRGQQRMHALMLIKQAKRLNEQDSDDKSLVLLYPLLKQVKWRTEQWWALLEDLSSVSSHAYDHLSPTSSNHRSLLNLKYDVPGDAGTTSLSTLPEVVQQAEQMVLHISDDEHVLPIHLSFAFANTQGYIGELTPCQIVLHQNINAGSGDSADLSIDGLVLKFGTFDLEIKHESSHSVRRIEFLDVGKPNRNDATQHHIISAGANLQIESRRDRILNLEMPVVEDETMALSAATIRARYLGQNLQISISRGLSTSAWWLETDQGLGCRDRRRQDSCRIDVLPKPARLQMQLLNARQTFFTHEEITLKIELENGEENELTGSLVAQIMIDEGKRVDCAWTGNPAAALTATEKDEAPSTSITSLAPSASRVFFLRYTAPQEPSRLAFAITSTYQLASKDNSESTKILEFSLETVQPMQTSYELLPRIDSKPWPDFFTIDPSLAHGGDDEPGGIPQHWCLIVSMSVSTKEALRLEDASIADNNAGSNLICKAGTPVFANSNLVEAGKDSRVEVPIMTCTKQLEDRRASDLDLNLSISWRRDHDDSPLTTSIVQVPRLSLPAVEPRALCSAVSTTVEGHAMLQVIYTVENPSMHFLTFNVAMEASHAFAFDGPKNMALSLTPMSRASISYTLFASAMGNEIVQERKHVQGSFQLQRGQWVMPRLSVVDAYFQKKLHVLAASDLVEHDERGEIKIWLAEAT